MPRSRYTGSIECFTRKEKLFMTRTIVLAINDVGNNVCCDGPVNGCSDCHKVKL